MYKVNTNYFDIVEREDQSYILAWFWSRGTGHIQLGRQDQEILYMIREKIGYTGEIYTRGNKVELNINNVAFRKHLEDCGCVRFKSCEQNFPIISPDLIVHFIRGIYDSYGHVRLCKDRYLNISIIYDETFISSLRCLLFDSLEM